MLLRFGRKVIDSSWKTLSLGSNET